MEECGLFLVILSAIVVIFEGATSKDKNEPLDTGITLQVGFSKADKLFNTSLLQVEIMCVVYLQPLLKSFWRMHHLLGVLMIYELNCN